MSHHSHSSSVSEITIHLNPNRRSDGITAPRDRPIVLRANSDQVANLKLYSSHLREKLLSLPEGTILILEPELEKGVNQGSLSLLIEILRNGSWRLNPADHGLFLDNPIRLYGLCCAIREYDVDLSVFLPASQNLRNAWIVEFKAGVEQPILDKFSSYSTWMYSHNWMAIAKVLRWGQIVLETYTATLWGSTEEIGDPYNLDFIETAVLSKSSHYSSW
jgi:hypothetical protein